MRWLLFLSRVAFICGFSFVLSISFLFREWITEGTISRTIITMGTFMAIIVIPGTLLCYLGVIMLRRKLTAIIPAWLIAANIVWMFLFLFYIIFLNGKGYNPS